MSLLVVGTLAYDSVETPSGKVDEALGGAATYFSVAASFFAPVRLVSIVGTDFKPEHRTLLERHDVDLTGLTVGDGETFRWAGKYEGDLNVAQTLDTRLNVLEGYEPKVPEAFRDSPFVFLANSPPALQAQVLDQVSPSSFKVMDTMNLWIQQTWDDLHALLPRVDMLVCNDQEALAIGEDHNLIRAGRKILAKGPKAVIVKKGEHGAFLWSQKDFFAIPAYPLETVTDPTGAGDCFAGGVMGYLASAGTTDIDHLKRAMVYGSVVASFNVEDFSLQRLEQISREDLDRRFKEYLGFTSVP
jgi:sugar/nucleoside kinase (ribokinase family)